MITALSVGGAQRMLIKLLDTMNRDRFQPSVICLTSGGMLASDVEELGVRLIRIGAKPGRVTPADAIRLLLAFHELKPDIVQGWMYHGNLASLTARIVRPRSPVVWNIRHSIGSLEDEKRLTRWIIRGCGWLSFGATTTIYNAHSTARQHESIGYKSGSVVIPNGFDMHSFGPSTEDKSILRRRLGIPEQTKLVGHVARFHPMKDHSTFVQAADIVATCMSDVRFLLVGPDVHESNAVLMEMIDRTRHSDKFILLGARRDMPKVMAALDLLVLSSAWGEAFPNVVGEAMACGVPAVVTDVGDAPLLVGKTGAVVPPAEPDAMADAICRHLSFSEEARSRRARAARERIKNLYSLTAIAQRYEEFYEEILKDGHR